MTTRADACPGETCVECAQHRTRIRPPLPARGTQAREELDALVMERTNLPRKVWED